MPSTGIGICWDGPRQAVAYCGERGYNVHLLGAAKFARRAIPSDLEKAAVVAPGIGAKHAVSNGLMLLLAKRLACQFMDNAPARLHVQVTARIGSFDPGPRHGV